MVYRSRKERKGKPGYVVTKPRSRKGIGPQLGPPLDSSSSSESSESQSNGVVTRQKAKLKDDEDIYSASTKQPSMIDIQSLSSGSGSDDGTLLTPREMVSEDEDVGQQKQAKVVKNRGEFDEYFGDVAIGDPMDDGSGDDEEDEVRAIAINKIANARKPYKKLEKQTAFINVLKLKKSTLFDSDTPRSIVESFEMWGVSNGASVKSQEMATIAPAIFDLGRYLHDREEKGKLRSKSTAVSSLITMYKVFNCSAMQDIEAEKARNAKLRAQIAGGGGGKKSNKKKENLIPEDINPITAVYCEKISECPGCLCKNTVAKIKTEEELVIEQAALDEAHAKRLKSNPKARRTIAQMTYGCMCPKSRTFSGDWKNSSCLACVKRGYADPNCKQCLCDCENEVFTMAQVQGKAMRAMEKRNKSATAAKKETSGYESLGGMIKQSMASVVERINKEDSPTDEKDALSMLANELKYKQFNSEKEMHDVQKISGAPTTKLNNGEDIRSVLCKGNKKKYSNNLR